MLELPDGITTSNGNWYHITVAHIEQYVPGLLKRYPLERMIKEADTWVKSADGLSLVLYFVLIYLNITPWIAAVTACVFYLIWFLNTSAFVVIAATPLLKILLNDGFVYTITGVLLIGISVEVSVLTLGGSIAFSAVWLGIALFFLFKVGLLRIALLFLLKKRSGVYITMQDRVLNMLLIRYGMKAGILTGKIRAMEEELIRLANYHKTRKKT